MSAIAPVPSMIRAAGRTLLLTGACAALALPALALADAWPQRPVRMVVGLPPGGTTDLVARATALRLGERLGQPVIVDNRPGASGAIAGELLARATPDGYTL